jgi:tetratricopeptide (TPR) repeat protein
MSYITKAFYILFVVEIACFSFSYAGHSECQENRVEIAKELYEQGMYLKSMKVLKDLLLTKKDGITVEAHIYLAFNYIAIGDKSKAVEQFKRALDIEPMLLLDAYKITPEIKTTFEEAKKERRFEFACCSCFIPGFGQMMKGEVTKGRVFIAASAITLAGTLISWAITASKRNHYLSLGFNETGEIARAYEDYDRWHKITIVSGATFLCIYIYGAIDAALAKASADDRRTANQGGIYLKPQRESISIGYSAKF